MSRKWISSTYHRLCKSVHSDANQIHLSVPDVVEQRTPSYIQLSQGFFQHDRLLRTAVFGQFSSLLVQRFNVNVLGVHTSLECLEKRRFQQNVNVVYRWPQDIPDCLKRREREREIEQKTIINIII